MKIHAYLIFVVMLGFVVAVSGCSTDAGPTNVSTPPSNTVTNTNPSTTTNPTTPTQTEGVQKLSDSRYAKTSYLISGPTLDDAAKTATSGFNIDKTVNSDGSTTFKLTSSNPEYQNQSYTLQQGQKLYFIEMNLGDDFDNNEGNIGDDKALITDANDNIIQGP